MDDGSASTFHGYRVLHSNILVPGKGGMRVHPQANGTSFISLPVLMVRKCVHVKRPFGEAKAGLAVTEHFEHGLGSLDHTPLYFRSG